MEIPTLHKLLLRYFSRPVYLYPFFSQSSYHFHSTSPIYFLISPAGSSFTTDPSFQSPQSLCGSIRLLSNIIGSEGIKTNATPKQVSEIIDLIRKDDDLESKLDLMNVSLSEASVIQIFRLLNMEKVSASRFFSWVKSSLYDLRADSDIYSLVINNCGLLDDYEGMLLVLNDFQMKGIILNQKAFGFLPVSQLKDNSTKTSVKKVVEVLNQVGGSCCVSAIHSLIEFFCTFGSFVMAKFVIEITEKRRSYYNIIIRHMCKRCDFERVRDTLDEMRQKGCAPNAGIYNYLLSSLFKNDETAEAYKVFEEMKDGACPPNAVTYEIFIWYLCKSGTIDCAFKFLDIMVSRGVEPRLETHAAFVKNFFSLNRYEEAYKYVVESGAKYGSLKNAVYSLLVCLHERKGNVVVAGNILSEMMEAGLRPNFPVYIRIFKRLRRFGREDLANDLKSKYSTFSLPAS